MLLDWLEQRLDYTQRKRLRKLTSNLIEIVYVNAVFALSCDNAFAVYHSIPIRRHPKDRWELLIYQMDASDDAGEENWCHCNS